MSRWPTVPVQEVLAKCEDWIKLDPETSYKQISARLWGKGLTLRGVSLGSEIAAATQLRVSSGQFLMSRIDARNGAFGVIPSELDGAIVSQDFPTFRVEEGRLSSRFLEWMSRTDWFVALCKRASEGSTNRVRLKEDRFLAQSIPLPPLEEQHRIVALSDGAAARIQVREHAARAVEAELAATLRAAFDRITASAPHARFGDVAPIVRRPVEIQDAQVYAELGVRSFGRGLFAKPDLVASDLTWQKLFRIEEGDLVFSNIKAWEGAFYVAEREHHGKVGSHRYLTCVCDRKRAIPKFVWFYLQTQSGLEQVQAASPGTADRNRTLNQKSLETIQLPLPSLDSQQWFEELQARAKQALATRSIAGELHKLLPAMLDRAFGFEAA